MVVRVYCEALAELVRSFLDVETDLGPQAKYLRFVDERVEISCYAANRSGLTSGSPRCSARRRGAARNGCPVLMDFNDRTHEDG